MRVLGHGGSGPFGQGVRFCPFILFDVRIIPATADGYDKCVRVRLEDRNAGSARLHTVGHEPEEQPRPPIYDALFH